MLAGVRIESGMKRTDETDIFPLWQVMINNQPAMAKERKRERERWTGKLKNPPFFWKVVNNSCSLSSNPPRQITSFSYSRSLENAFSKISALVTGRHTDTSDRQNGDIYQW